MLFNRNSKPTFAAGAALALALLAPIPAAADCFDDAAQYHNVNPWILRAIAAVESNFNPTVVHPRNTDGSVDEGLMGINSIHAPDLARYGVSTGDMRDGCKSVYLGAWHLRNRINERGNTWQGIGTYHSKTPSKRDAYAAKIRRIIDFWIERGIIPR
ncbi:lytic transglycosylase domain-containing protein [Massilia sp. LC238]|jgi:soluble lytic murein transglycosylase-like protein|uniref:lytic transglycosylase domain-containing protein n=1 Tax=Massilia sp. LC238 TaxID=1502852 RepID=UPI0004E3EE5F|nr:lytic transglycosylase domain-containing protein [Massilia sp. LC238]KFC72657.1 PilT [Massilia sp. LC238]